MVELKNSGNLIWKCLTIMFITPKEKFVYRHSWKTNTYNKATKKVSKFTFKERYKESNNLIQNEIN